MPDEKIIAQWLREQLLPATRAALRERFLFGFLPESPAGDPDSTARRYLDLLDQAIAAEVAVGTVQISGDRSLPYTEMIDRLSQRSASS